jgi:hypothetical protein
MLCRDVFAIDCNLGADQVVFVNAIQAGYFFVLGVYGV